MVPRPAPRGRRLPRALSPAVSLLLTLGLALSLSPVVPAAAGGAAPKAATGSLAAPRLGRAVDRRATKRLSSGCRLNRRGVPRCGALLGAAYGANTDPQQFERSVGKRLGVRRTYFRADQVDSAMKIARQDLRRGRLPWMSFKLPRSWAAMDSEWGASWARGVALRLRRLPGPVWVAFHHEPENDGQSMGDWKRMQERLLPAVRRTAPNVAYTVILMGYHQFYGDAKYRLSRTFPSGRVDVVGFDIYDKYGQVRDGKRETRPTPHPEYFRKIKRFANRRGVAWGLAETGYTNWASSRRPRWIENTYLRLRRHGGVALSYFNTSLHSASDWTLTKTSKRRDFARALRRSPRFPRWR